MRSKGGREEIAMSIMSINMSIKILRQYGAVLFMRSIVAVALLMVWGMSASSAMAKNVIIVIDSSGSIKHKDPKGYRKMAAQALVSLLDPHDLVAIEQFDSKGLVLQDWIEAVNTQQIFKAISRAGKNGQYTDFRAALETAIGLVKRLKSTDETVVLLFTDGEFDPDIYSDRYAPYNLTGFQSRKDRKLASKKILPKAQRIIEEELLPQFREYGVQIFTLAFRIKAKDRQYLKMLSDATTRFPSERHHFYVQSPMDLMDAFFSLLAYLDYGHIVFRDEYALDRQSPPRCRTVYLDSFFMNASFIVAADSRDIRVKLSGYQSMDGTHEFLTIIPIKRDISGKKNICIEGSGRFKTLLVGKDNFKIRVKGLKARYLPGERIKAMIELAPATKGASVTLNGLRPVCRIMPLKRQKEKAKRIKNIKEITLTPVSKGDVREFSLDYQPEISGDYLLTALIKGRDSGGHPIIPRKSRQYRFTVEKGFFIDADRVSLGTVDSSKNITATVRMFAIDTSPRTVTVNGRLSAATACDPSLEPQRIPHIKPLTIKTTPGTYTPLKLALVIPKDHCWGDFQIEVTATTDTGSSDKVLLTLHIPSLYEKLTIPVLIGLVIAMAVFIFLLMGWLSVPLPRGSLEVSDEDGNIRIFNLRRHKKGLSRYLWARNRLMIGPDEEADIRLENCPAAFTLKFYRRKRVYLIIHKGTLTLLKDGEDGEEGQILTTAIQIDSGASWKANPQDGQEKSAYEFNFNY